jgi:hypothetical protein
VIRSQSAIGTSSAGFSSHRLRVGNVDPARRPAAALRHGFGAVEVDVADDDMPALVGQRPADHLTDAAGATGDHRDRLID